MPLSYPSGIQWYVVPASVARWQRMIIFFASLVSIRAVAAEVDVDDVAVAVKGFSLILQEGSKIYFILYL